MLFALIRSSKTDQWEIGAARTLRDNSTNLRPVAALHRLIDGDSIRGPSIDVSQPMGIQFRELLLLLPHLLLSAQNWSIP